MKQFAAALLLFVSVLTAFAAPDRRDGNWWRSQPQLAKRAYVIGWFDGLNGAGRAENAHMKSPEFVQMRNEMCGMLGNANSGQVADGLDIFYADFRNRSILVYDAIWHVLAAARGASPEQLDEIVRKMRSDAR